MINSVESFLDTPTSKKYLAIIIELIDDRYIKTFLGIAIGTHHVITGKQGFRDPKNYSIYLNDNGINTPLKLTPIQFIQNLRYQKKLCIVAVKERIPNEYIIPLTTVLNPDGKIGHYLGMGNTYTYTFTKSYVEKFLYDLISSWKLYYFKDILKLIVEFWQSCTGMGAATSTERVTRGLVEAEGEIIFKEVTTEFHDWQYLKVVFQKVCEIDKGSPLLISEGGRFVLQGLHMFCSCRRKKSYYFFFEIKGEIQCYGHFINIGEELQWINEIINKKIGFSSS